jgi:hypothetical protein
LLPVATLQSTEIAVSITKKKLIINKLIAHFFWCFCDKVCHRSDNLRHQNSKKWLLCWNKSMLTIYFQLSFA